MFGAPDAPDWSPPEFFLNVAEIIGWPDELPNRSNPDRRSAPNSVCANRRLQSLGTTQLRTFAWRRFL